jgi:hypothetical protein
MPHAHAASREEAVTARVYLEIHVECQSLDCLSWAGAGDADSCATAPGRLRFVNGQRGTTHRTSALGPQSDSRKVDIGSRNGQVEAAGKPITECVLSHRTRKQRCSSVILTATAPHITRGRIARQHRALSWWPAACTRLEYTAQSWLPKAAVGSRRKHLISRAVRCQQCRTREQD